MRYLEKHLWPDKGSVEAADEGDSEREEGGDRRKSADEAKRQDRQAESQRVSCAKQSLDFIPQSWGAKPRET